MLRQTILLKCLFEKSNNTYLCLLFVNNFYQ